MAKDKRKLGSGCKIKTVPEHPLKDSLRRRKNKTKPSGNIDSKIGLGENILDDEFAYRLGEFFDKEENDGDFFPGPLTSEAEDDDPD